MTFLYEYGDIIDLGWNILTVRKPETPQKRLTPNSISVRIADEHVKLPQRASAFLLVEVDTFLDGEALLEGNIRRLLEKGIGVARKVLQLHCSRTPILAMNFGNEQHHFTKGIAVALVERIAKYQDVSATSNDDIPTSEERQRVLTFTLAQNFQ